eukprot:CAMPEP_0202897162 /NCGR_PEP_ID=MMETSP1392-20130828/6001_1 /ASSEMBLY_ACC=CAM_ASM_000868 /TAXON_ID=225041 /ORGANISM="Chlamydomonas chlamydogama, Strain SAG 11-48b" /LENGTH=238 /DNA_ID=CAMNT_0049582735 /DNA_START=290 /DNA_END=1006 /DNA_ORIENTATION=+
MIWSILDSKGTIVENDIREETAVGCVLWKLPLYAGEFMLVAMEHWHASLTRCCSLMTKCWHSLRHTYPLACHLHSLLSDKGWRSSTAKLAKPNTPGSAEAQGMGPGIPEGWGPDTPDWQGGSSKPTMRQGLRQEQQQQPPQQQHSQGCSSSRCMTLTRLAWAMQQVVYAAHHAFLSLWSVLFSGHACLVSMVVLCSPWLSTYEEYIRASWSCEAMLRKWSCIAHDCEMQTSILLERSE